MGASKRVTQRKSQIYEGNVPPPAVYQPNNKPKPGKLSFKIWQSKASIIFSAVKPRSGGGMNAYARSCPQLVARNANLATSNSNVCFDNYLSLCL